MQYTGSIKQLVDYIKKNLKKGYTPDSLKWALLNQGYTKASVERAIKEANMELAKTVPKLKEKPVIKYELLDEQDKPIKIKKSFWKRLLGD